MTLDTTGNVEQVAWNNIKIVNYLVCMLSLAQAMINVVVMLIHDQ